MLVASERPLFEEVYYEHETTGYFLRGTFSSHVSHNKTGDGDKEGEEKERKLEREERNGHNKFVKDCTSNERPQIEAALQQCYT